MIPRLGQILDDLLCPGFGQIVDVDVADSAVAPGDALALGPGAHLEHLEPLGGGPIGHLHRAESAAKGQ